ncbi:hypothetical protein ABPG72_012932 [Tetrahymena utriculariae]
MGNKSAKECIFCQIRDSKNNQAPFYEDDEIFAFEDINISSSRRHILICPKQHIKNVNQLNYLDIELVKRLEQVGIQTLQESHPNQQYRFGYHSPPLNSIDHLHLHGFVLPISNCINNKILYGYFLTSNQQIIKKLEKQQPML